VTLYKWRKEARAAGVETPGNGQTNDKWSNQDKYREQIEAWRMVCLQANSQVFDQSKQLKGSLKEEQKRAKQLEKELQKKVKALAEDAALLLLRKKTQAILKDDEEE
jgi:hypothetical protein